MTEQQIQQLEREFSAIARHDWLSGHAFMQMAERVARGYFDDVPEPFNVQDALDAAAAELAKEIG